VRVLLVNAFHYPKGGVERTYFDESRWLSEAGHAVAHLATRDPRNRPSPTAESFAPAADFAEDAPALVRIGQLGRVVWSRAAERASARIVESFRPEIAHVHAPSRYLTPSVLRPLERAGVPIVFTLHDLKPWCTNRILFAHGAPCERCRGGTHWHALARGCVQSSYAASAVGMVEAYVHDWVDAYRGVRLWIAPSRFVRDKAADMGLDPAGVRVLPHGLTHEPPAGNPARVPGEPFVLVAGRLSVEKGVRLLPGLAMRLAPVPVVVVGDGPLRTWLDAQTGSVPNLRVLGRVDDAELAALRAAAAVVVVPSLFYEHFCYAAAEALLDGRPVVAARIGAIPELVEDRVTGRLAAPGDVAGLADAVRGSLERPDQARAWAEAGRERVRAVVDPERHLAGLLALYREAGASG